MTIPPTPARISRQHLDALCRMGRVVPEPVEPDVIAELEALGALHDGACHPDLTGTVAVLNAVESKLHVRRWYHGNRSHMTGFLGPAGVALLIGPVEPDAPVRVVHRPRPTTTPRLLASFVGLGPTRAVAAPVPREPMSWSDVLAITSAERPAWVTEVAGPDIDPVVWDLALQANPDVASANVLNVIGFGGEVLAEVRAVDRTDPSSGFRLNVRPPGAIWWALCRIVRGSGSDPPPGPAVAPPPDISPTVDLTDAGAPSPPASTSASTSAPA